jgi:PAS domain-containing protein
MERIAVSAAGSQPPPVTQKSIQLILARNLMASISTPSFLVDELGALVFYNEAAGALLGRRFEEMGKLGAMDWTAQFGPFAPDGSPLPIDELPLTIALRHGRPSHARLRVRSLLDGDHDIVVSALPIVGDGGFRGAMAFFWPVDEDD